MTTSGGGNDTGIAQIVADRLGIPIEDNTVVQGDTGLCPYGFGNYSGRSILVGGSAAYLAATEIREKLAKAAGALLEARDDDLELGGGMITVKGTPEKAIPIASVAYAIYTLAFAVTHMVDPPLESTRVYKPDNISHFPDEKGRIQVPVRLLPARDALRGEGVPRRAPVPERRGDPRRDRRQPLPLHGLREHRQGNRDRRRAAA